MLDVYSLAPKRFCQRYVTARIAEFADRPVIANWTQIYVAVTVITVFDLISEGLGCGAMYSVRKSPKFQRNFCFHLQSFLLPQLYLLHLNYLLFEDYCLLLCGWNILWLKVTNVSKQSCASLFNVFSTDNVLLIFKMYLFIYVMPYSPIEC
jgi:hypothetical protein